jgi:soluble lytic murein transglycosylase-like protein
MCLERTGLLDSTPRLFPKKEMLIRSTRSVWFQIALAIGSAAAVLVAASMSTPVYMTRSSVAQQLMAHQYVDSMSQRAPWLRVSTELALKSPQFLRDRELFTMDLLRTGHVSLRRARALADVAVREAYTRRIPPALVLGVMLTENDELNSSARSSVGAVGLMQVYPRAWEELGDKFGTEIGTDSVNLKYGIYILGHLAEKAAAAAGTGFEASWRKALLSYNGCVRGTNSPNCFSYPDEVRRQVQRAARSTCDGADFNRCVVQPLWQSKRDEGDVSGGTR